MATILVVDDLAANRALLVTLLRHHGHRLIEAADGSQGLAAVRTERPDLVITDVLMPVMDGYELVRQLRLDPATSGIPVVFYTAHYGEREARALALSSGVSDVLTKPAQSAEVLRIVARVLSGESATGKPPRTSPLTADFDRDHLRLLTDKLSETAGGLRNANARLRAVINIGLELASERDADRLLQRVCVAARELFGATYVTLGIVDLDDRTVQRFLSCGTDANCGSGAATWIKAGDKVSGILEMVVAERRTVRGDNPGGDPTRLHFPVLHPDVQAFLVAPIGSPAHVYGWMCLVGNEGRTFTDDDEGLVMALAGQVGRIYELEDEIVERKQAESALRYERDRAQRYLDTADVILLALDTNGRITLVNRYACSVLGWTADELRGRSWSETCLPARIQTAFATRFANLLGGDLSVIENAILTKSGEERLFEWRNTVLRDDADNVTGTISSGTDITDRKLAEGAQRASEGRYRTLFEYAPDGIVIADRESYYVDANPSVCRMLGYTRDELIGLHASDIVNQTEIPQIRLALHAITTTSDYHREWQFRRKDGSVFVADVIATPMPDGNLLGMIRDVTERNHAIDALRTAEERTRFALEAAGVGIWDMNFSTGVIQCSTILESQYGLQPGAFDGTFEMFAGRIHPDDRESVVETLMQAKAGADFFLQHRTLWPDGTVRWLSGAGRVLLGEHGEPLRGVGISLDVTERHTLEEQFQQAQKMEAIGRLAGGVAHDFNNLLTVILGFCELSLAGLAPDDPRQADIGEIQKAGMSAAELTRQLLAFSRKQIIQPTQLDLNVVVADLRGMLERLIGEDVTVVLRLGAELAHVMADRGQIEQIVLNLAVNARDAMPSGGTLTIETANVELDEHYAKSHLAVTPGPHVVLTMTDTGIGMSPQVQARLFEPFFTTKEPGKGTGLGLAMVHGIVAQSGGIVNVHSEVGRGTSFTVYFPRADAAAKVIDTPPAVARPRTAIETVLVVEDADGLRELTKRLLERQGYTVLVAANAEEARQLFDRNPSISVLLTDVVMPGASGPELTRQLVEQRPALKVIYMSGYTEEAIVHRGILDPGIAFLHKPFTSDTLGRKIREVLDRPAEDPIEPPRMPVSD
jgi:PAS domain S-box-containing protein